MASMVYTRLVAALEAHIKEEQLRVRERTGTDLDTFLGILNAYGPPACHARAGPWPGGLMRKRAPAPTAGRRPHRTWQRQVQQTIMIRSILLYLDRTYVLQTGQQSIYDVSLNLFRCVACRLGGTGHDRPLTAGRVRARRCRRPRSDYIVKEPAVSERLVQGLLSMIERERNGEAIDRAALTALVRMLSTLQLYDALFQPPFLEASRRYYVAAGDRFQAEVRRHAHHGCGRCGSGAQLRRAQHDALAAGCGGLQLDVPDLLLRIEGCLKDEADRVALYLDPSTRKPLVEIVEQNLLQAHSMQIVERGFEPLLVGPRHGATA